MAGESASQNMVSRRRFLGGAAATGGLILLPQALGGLVGGAAASASASADLEVFGGFPRAVFFLKGTSLATKGYGYEEWEEALLPLNGTIENVTEEVVGRPATAAEYCRRFKSAHPGKLMLAHFNGTGRVPMFRTENFFSGHWLYHPGTTLLQAVEADPQENVLHVADSSIFLTETGNFRDRADEIGVARVAPDGSIDWQRSEQLKLVSISPEDDTIVVERGQFGTLPLAWPAGTYLAPHVIRGPFGQRAAGYPLLWVYNFSTTCPRDSRGRVCSDILVEDLASMFAPGGVFEGFDGIEFDVPAFTMVEAPRVRPGLVDADADGVADSGFVDGVNVYGAGTVEFFEKLRSRLPDKLILADGQRIVVRVPPEPPYSNNRSFGLLNGAETEGFLDITDYQVEKWSEGLNILNFWQANSANPALSYINVKHRPTPRPDELNYPWNRLIFAAATSTGATIGQLDAPPDSDRIVGVFDELRQGVEDKPNWLGAPLAAPVHVAERTDDLLRGGGVSWRTSFIGQWSADEDVRLRVQQGGGQSPRMVISATGDTSTGLGKELLVRFPGVEVPNDDLLVVLDISGEPLPEYSSRIARYMDVTATARTSGMTIARASWANQNVFTARFYMRDIGPDTVDLEFRIEGRVPVTFHRLQAHASPDAIYQEFEHGAIFANPSTRPYTFPIAELMPGRAFRRIQGSPEQDTAVNNGQPLSGSLTIGAIDGLFVVKDQ